MQGKRLSRVDRLAAASMSTTFIFGAGASCDIGYPLATNMGAELLRYMSNSPTPDFRSASTFFQELFGVSPDIERVMTEVQQRVEDLANSPDPFMRIERGNLSHQLSWIGYGIQQWFREIRQRPSASYELFAQSIVQPGDTVITFNYDDSLDRELRRSGKWQIEDGYGFRLGQTQVASQVRLLKLHGSINWLVSVFGGKTGFFQGGEDSLGFKPVIHQVDLDFLGYTALEGSTFVSGVAFPCLILPTRNKRFFYRTSFGDEYAPFWDSLWSEAAVALRRSTRVVLCGYGLLPVDERACELILKRARPESEFEIICGSQTTRISDVVSSAGFMNVKPFVKGYFADWLASQGSV